ALALADARSSDPARPGTTAERNGSGWVLTGEKRFVGVADAARRMLVPARAGDPTRVFLVDPQAPGVTLAPHRLSTGEPVFTVAKFWAAEGGARIAAAAQHLHGGIGVDLDYPIHRYFLHSKVHELALGGATPQLARLGRDLAASGPVEPA